MADQQLVLRAERWNDIVILSKSILDVGADIADYMILPAGIGDVAVMEMIVSIAPIDTIVTTDRLGVVANIQNAARDTTVDILGAARFVQVANTASAGALVAYLSPDPLVLWRQNEVMIVAFPEIDTDATPGADASVVIKCVRVRPVETATRELQLVR